MGKRCGMAGNAPGRAGRPLERLTAARFAVAVCLAGLAAVSLWGRIGLAQLATHKGRNIDGVGNLKWGTSVAQATNAYRDLHFNKYVVENEKEEPSKIYVRKNEYREMYGVVFDSVDYWFKGDRFYQITAILHSKIGPRTLVTRAEDGFDRMSSTLRNEYGDPKKVNVSYVGELILAVKETTWDAGDSTITVRYDGPEEMSEDRLSIRIRKK